jgi:N-acetyl-gamma-glutamyl-phosphate/LysW-gamma-L-alpha-aminoadipyl-6-phosphate reductase
LRVSILGGSGYVGGELLRYLLTHPLVEVAQVASQRYAGKPIAQVHPNLRRATSLSFVHPSKVGPCDLLFLALPHGRAAASWKEVGDLADAVVDLSADFRLRDPKAYEAYYGWPHPQPDLLPTFAYGLPEVHRKGLAGASRVAVSGCIAAATIIALRPLVEAGLIEEDVVVDAKAGSSGSGRSAGEGSHHPERSGVIRLYSATGHRHTPEVEQELGAWGPTQVHLSVHAVEAVRGILVTCHAFAREEVDDGALWGLYRRAYGGEPFVGIVKATSGLHRMPEPKLLAGTNYCDVGFQADPERGRIVAVAALDNLGKGAAGNAVQCMNVMMGFPEAAGLGAQGLHPL